MGAAPMRSFNGDVPLQVFRRRAAAGPSPHLVRRVSVLIGPTHIARR